MLTAAEARRLFDYDPEAGVLMWRVRTNNRAPVGSIAGCMTQCSGLRRWIIGCKKRQYLRSRLVWLWVHGEWPDREVDHINGDSLDDRHANLRLADHSQNNWNKLLQMSNSSGFAGVDFHRKTGKWRARITVRGKTVALGYYATAEQAAVAREAAELEHFGEFRRRAASCV